MKLLLFDIDGTILHAHGSGRRSVEAALEGVAGQPISTEGIPFSGKTDPQILREVLEANGLAPETVQSILKDAVQAYTEAARADLSVAQVEVYPGVAELIGRLAKRDDVQLSLLTGNVEEMAYAKLDAGRINSTLFPFGAFGSDHADRYQLPAIARDRALSHTGRTFDGADIVIIGDTKHDILCGRSIGVTSIAVATGHYSREDLAPHGPDHLFDDLTDHDAFLAALNL